jgi:recombination protein RecT
MSAQNTTAVAETKNGTSVVAKSTTTPSERFTMAVMKNFSQDNGEVQITPFQKRLCQSYFIKIDQMLKSAEVKRMAKSEQYREDLAYSWENVNMNKLAVDVVSYSSVGLDPMQKNHLHPIPYKNNAINKYDISFTKGYNGIELVAKKYGFEVPDDVIIRIVYAKEKFFPIYKDAENKKESFTHKPSDNPFDKGDVVGGYYYHVYYDNPEKNKLRVFSIAEIEKRIPRTASVEFWGGEKDKWENGKKAGKEKVEGWRDEMIWKTLKRAAWDAVAIDSQKIDDHVQKILSEQEVEVKQEIEDLVKSEIKTEANKETLDFEKASEEIDFEEVKNSPSNTTSEATAAAAEKQSEETPAQPNF